MQGFDFALRGWFRRFCLPPLPLVLFRFRRSPLFFSLAHSGFAHAGPGVLACVCSFLSFLRSFLVFRLSKFHVIFTFISFPCPFHSHFHLMVRTLISPSCGRVCVCVCNTKGRLSHVPANRRSISGHGIRPIQKTARRIYFSFYIVRFVSTAPMSELSFRTKNENSA